MMHLIVMFVLGILLGMSFILFVMGATKTEKAAFRRAYRRKG